MKRIPLTLLALAGAVAAQTPQASPSPVFLASEGPSYATSFGAFAAARYQIADANQRGSSLVVKSIFLRHDHRDYTVDTGMGRSWTDLRISVATGDQASLSTTFSANALTTPTQVFSGATSWPLQLGPTSFAPALTGIAIPFSAPWNYAGTQDILLDATFVGGRLANQAAWSGSSAVPYYLDSFGVGVEASSGSTSLGLRNGGCVDSSRSGPAGATVDLSSTTYSSAHPNPALQGQVTLEANGDNFPASAPVIYVQTFNANLPGIPFPGISCNKIHIDIGRARFLHPVTSNAAGVIPPYYFGLPGGQSPFNPAWAGVQVVTMAVWNDTVTGGLKLSNTSRVGLVDTLYGATSEVKMSVVYGADPAASVASFAATGVSSAIPLMIYVQ